MKNVKFVSILLLAIGLYFLPVDMNAQQGRRGERQHQDRGQYNLGYDDAYKNRNRIHPNRRRPARFRHSVPPPPYYRYHRNRRIARNVFCTPRHIHRRHCTCRR